MNTPGLSCIGHSDLYDLALFDDTPSAERAQAVHRAAALCVSCPSPCDQKVTADTQPVELVLLHSDWMPLVREGKPEPELPKAGGRRRKQDGVPVGQDYVRPNDRVGVWAEMAASRARDGHRVADIAVDLCVTEDTAVRLIELGQARLGWGRAA